MAAAISEVVTKFILFMGPILQRVQCTTPRLMFSILDPKVPFLAIEVYQRVAHQVRVGTECTRRVIGKIYFQHDVTVIGARFFPLEISD